MAPPWLILAGSTTWVAAPSLLIARAPARACALVAWESAADRAFWENKRRAVELEGLAKAAMLKELEAREAVYLAKLSDAMEQCRIDELRNVAVEGGEPRVTAAASSASEARLRARLDALLVALEEAALTREVDVQCVDPNGFDP